MLLPFPYKSVPIGEQKQAGAELGQPQLKLELELSFTASYFGGNLLKTILWLLLGENFKIQQIRHVLVIKWSYSTPR